MQYFPSHTQYVRSQAYSETHLCNIHGLMHVLSHAQQCILHVHMHSRLIRMNVHLPKECMTEHRTIRMYDAIMGTHRNKL